MTQYAIGPGMEVKLHFALKLEDGTVVDSTFDKEPAVFQVGDGNLPEGFEKAINGFVPGDHKTLEILPEQAFGQRNPNNIQQFPRDQFDSDMELEPGLVLSFADASKSELPGVIDTVTEDTVTVDFNHPLAGRTLSFEVEVLEVTPARN